MSYRERVSSPGRNKLLALDGGGIRAVIILAVLQRMESMLAEQLGADYGFVLPDFNKQDLLCRVFGRCRHGAPIDREVGNLMQREGLLQDRLFSYVCYNAELSRRGLDQLGVDDVFVEEVQKLDCVEHIADLRRVGQAVARDVAPQHFAGFLASGA